MDYTKCKPIAFCKKCRGYSPFEPDADGYVPCQHCAANHVRWWQDWHWRFSYGPEVCYRDTGWRTLTIGFLKEIRERPEGVMLRKGDYRGFLFSIRIWLPWEVVR